MIEIARGKAPDATFTCADIFNWPPDRAYDTVFFGFWLSHIPPARFKSFWWMVGAALKPGGTVCFLHSGHAAAPTQWFPAGRGPAARGGVAVPAR